MATRDMQLILRAIENCENRERRFCEAYTTLNPEDMKRRERDRDMYLYATMQVRFEIERMVKEDERRLKGETQWHI